MTDGWLEDARSLWGIFRLSLWLFWGVFRASWGVFVRVYENLGVLGGLYENLGAFGMSLEASLSVFFVGASRNHPLQDQKNSLGGIFESGLVRSKYIHERPQGPNDTFLDISDTP